MATKILELCDALYAAVEAKGDEKDHRFQSWCKEVTGIDSTKQDGYCFVGEFVRQGTVEVTLRPTLYLVMTQEGSMRFHHATYRLVEMDAEGNLTPTDLYTTSAKPGWALRLRERVAERLAALKAQPPSNPLAAFSDAELLAELARRELKTPQEDA
jgi:hypothetical protein